MNLDLNINTDYFFKSIYILGADSVYLYAHNLLPVQNSKNIFEFL